MKKILSLITAFVLCTSFVSAKTIYCKMEQGWWKADNAAVGCHYWGTPGPGTSWPGVRMTPVEGETDLWSIELDTDKVQNVIFTRVNPSGAIADWGAKTKDLEIPTDDKNLFTITTSSESWGDPGCDGTWSVYGGAVEKPKHNYTITVYLPAFCDDIAAYADSARVMGGFDDWSNGIWMEKKIDEDFNDCWYAEIYDVEEGTAFKLRFGTDADWKVQVQLNGANMANEAFGETTDIVLHYDGEGYGFAACPAPVARKEFVFVAGEAAEANPALFAITWGKDGSNETVKMTQKGEEALYTANILETVDSLVLVRCASGATEIIWDGEGKNVWNQTGNYAICDTMYFGAWVDDSNLFTITCEAPKPVEVKYYLKNNWNGAAEWSWKEMTKKEEAYVLDSVIFGGTGVNLNTKEDDADAKWFDLKKMKYNEQDTIQALDTVRFELSVSDKDTVLTAIKLGRPAPAPRKEFVFVAGEAAEANPAMFAITWGKDGSNETVKMTQKGEEALYTANILETVDSLVLVRCASDATEIIWDGEGKNVWNQTANYALCDTMYFESWVPETNLFAVTCEAPKPVETKYYAKNNWNGGEWSWKEMDLFEENIYVLDSVVFGGTGVNINTKEDDADALWFKADSNLIVIDATGDYGTPQPPRPQGRDTIPYAPRRAGETNISLFAGDTIQLAFNAADSTLTAYIFGRPQPECEPGYAIIVNGERHMLSLNAEQQDYTEYWIDSLELKVDDEIVLFDTCAQVTFKVAVKGYEGFEPVGESDTLRVTEDAYYQFYLKLIYGADELYVVKLEEPQPVCEPGYAIMVNGERHMLSLNAEQQDYTEYWIDSLELKADDEIVLFDTCAATTFKVAVKGYEGFEPVGESDTLRVTEGAYYQFYLKLIYGADELYVVKLEEPVEHKSYVTGNAALVGEEKAWQADAIEMVDYTHTFPMLAAGEYQLKVTDGTWEHSWGYDNLSPTVAVEGLYTDVDGNICFTVYTPNDVTVTFAQGYVVVTGDFKNPQPADEGFGIILSDGSTIKGQKNEGQVEFEEYVTVADLTAGATFQLYDFANEAAWTVDNIDEASTPNLTINEDYVYEVTADGKYTIYLKMYGMGNDQVYCAYEGTGTNLNKVKAAQGQRFNVLGLPVNANYRGVVIMNGQTYLQ